MKFQRYFYIPVCIQDEVKKFFAESQPINYLRIVDIVDDTKHNLKDLNEKGSSKDVASILSFIFNKHAPRGSNWELFSKEVSKAEKSRKVAGLCIKNRDSEVLFVQNYKDQIYLPVGKQSYVDFDSLRLTALREGAEESNIWFCEQEFEKIYSFFEYLDRGKTIRIFKISNFDRKRVDLNHSRYGEIKRLWWLNKNEASLYTSLSTETINNMFDDEKCNLDTDKSGNWSSYSEMINLEEEFVARKKKIIGDEKYKRDLDFFKCSYNRSDKIKRLEESQKNRDK